MKVKNLVIGTQVQVKSEGHTGFYTASAGKFGTIVDTDMQSPYLDVQVRYDDGRHEWGNHRGIKRVKGGLTLQDVKVGDRVEILVKRSTAFFGSNRGRIGTVTHLDPDSCLDVRVKFDDGDTDWGNHSDIRIVTEPKPIKVGSRVRLVRDRILGFLAGDVGTVKFIASDGTAVVHFDVARNGFKSPDYGIPNLCGLWVTLKDLEVITD